MSKSQRFDADEEAITELIVPHQLGNLVTLEAALAMLERRLPVTICVGKQPLGFGWTATHPGKDWGQQVWTRSEVERAFRIRSGELTVGMKLGPEAGIIDIEADSEEEEADFEALFQDCSVPRTPTFKSRRGMHRLFAWHPDLEHVHKGVVKFHNLGCRIGADGKAIHSCIPPSATDGTAREWLVSLDECDPAPLPPVVVQRIIAAANNEPHKQNGHAANGHHGKTAIPDAPAARVNAAVHAMRRIKITDSNDGSRRLITYCCRCIEHDLSDAQSVTAIRRMERERPFPSAFSIVDIQRRLRDAEKKTERGVAVSTDGLVPLGQRDPQTDKLILSSQRTLPTARAYIEDHHQHEDGPTLRSYTDLLFNWSGSRYEQLEDGAVKGRLQPWLHNALRYKQVSKGEPMLVPFDANPNTVASALVAIKAHVHLPATVSPPAWLDGADGPPPTEILLCRSGLLHLPTMKALEPTPLLFATNAMDFDYNAQAPPPVEWFKFLHQLFKDDRESLDLLKEWFGYCLTAGTNLQKMLLIVGPRRSGKGTIARVLSRLVGSGNVVGPTTESLSRPFGLQPLIAKTLAIVSDARFRGESIPTVVERLLCISGEDAISIDRKFLASVTMKLPTRFVFLTNELPRLTDASGALAGRFMILRMTRSFYGHEDTGLTDKLMTELPGILNWAIEGWHHLYQRGRFVQPQSVREAVHDMEDLASPVGCFVREKCITEPGKRVCLNDLYEAWKQWCSADGRTTYTTRQTFGRDLAAAVPHIKRRRGKGDVRFYEGIRLKAEG